VKLRRLLNYLRDEWAMEWTYSFENEQAHVTDDGWGNPVHYFTTEIWSGWKWSNGRYIAEGKGDTMRSARKSALRKTRVSQGK